MYNILFVYKINKALITRPIKIKEKIILSFSFGKIIINGFSQSSIQRIITNTDKKKNVGKYLLYSQFIYS